MSEIVLVQIEGIIDLEDDLVAAILAVRHLGPDRTDNEPSIFRAALSRVERYTISELKSVIHLVHCHLIAAENRRGRAIILAPIMTLQCHTHNALSLLLALPTFHYLSMMFCSDLARKDTDMHI